MMPRELALAPKTPFLWLSIFDTPWSYAAGGSG